MNFHIKINFCLKKSFTSVLTNLSFRYVPVLQTTKAVLRISLYECRCVEFFDNSFVKIAVADYMRHVLKITY